MTDDEKASFSKRESWTNVHPSHLFLFSFDIRHWYSAHTTATIMQYMYNVKKKEKNLFQPGRHVFRFFYIKECLPLLIYSHEAISLIVMMREIWWNRKIVVVSLFRFFFHFVSLRSCFHSFNWQNAFTSLFCLQDHKNKHCHDSKDRKKITITYQLTYIFVFWIIFLSMTWVIAIANKLRNERCTSLSCSCKWSTDTTDRTSYSTKSYSQWWLYSS